MGLRDCCSATCGCLVNGIVITGIAVVGISAFAVAGAVAPVVGVVGLLGGVPYYFYRRSQLNKQAQITADRLQQIANQVLEDPEKVINRKNYMDTRSKYHEQGELESLKERLSKLEHNKKIRSEIENVRAPLEAEERRMNSVAKWVRTFALCLFAHIGLVMALCIHAQPGGSLYINKFPDFDDLPEAVAVRQGHMFIDEEAALKYHIARTERLRDRMNAHLAVGPRRQIETDSKIRAAKSRPEIPQAVLQQNLLPFFDGKRPPRALAPERVRNPVKPARVGVPAAAAAAAGAATATPATRS